MKVSEIIRDYNDYVIKQIEPNYQSEFQYRNGVHLLFITKIYSKFYLCGLATGFHVMCHKNNYDVYEVFTDIVSAVREFERFISLLLLPKRFEEPVNEKCIYQRDLF